MGAEKDDPSLSQREEEHEEYLPSQHHVFHRRGGFLPQVFIKTNLVFKGNLLKMLFSLEYYHLFNLFSLKFFSLKIGKK